MLFGIVNDPPRGQFAGPFEVNQGYSDGFGFEILSPDLPRRVRDDLVVFQETTFHELLDRVLADVAVLCRMTEGEDIGVGNASSLAGNQVVPAGRRDAGLSPAFAFAGAKS